MTAARVALIALGILAGCDAPSQKAATAPVKPLSSFEFRGMKPKLGAVNSCEPSGKDETRCMFVKWRVGDVPFKMGDSYLIFKAGKLDWFTIRTYPEDYDRLAVLLRSIYGEPCNTASVPLQNAFGAKFSGDESRWCFKEGALTLRRHSNSGDRVTSGDLDYFTDHPENAEPAQTYDAKTL